MGAAMSLSHEVSIFYDHLSDMLGVNDVNEGKYAVVKGDAINGPFETYEAALSFAYAEHGPTPFLVKKIERNESILYFGRSIR